MRTLILQLCWTRKTRLKHHCRTYISSITWKSSICHDAGAKHDESRVLLGGAQSISGPTSTTCCCPPARHSCTRCGQEPRVMLPHIGHHSQALQSSFPAAADPCHHTEARADGPQQGSVPHRAAEHRHSCASQLPFCSCILL